MDSFYSPIFVNLEEPSSADKLYFCASITHKIQFTKFPQKSKEIYSRSLCLFFWGSKKIHQKRKYQNKAKQFYLLSLDIY